MSARHLTEWVVNLVTWQIQNNIETALQDLGQVLPPPSPVVSLEKPRDYFIYPRAIGYRTPCVFVIADRIDFQKREKGANHINANVRVNVTVLIEDKDADRITRKAYRYQSALQSVLDQAQLLSSDLEPSDTSLKIVSVVQNAAFSPLYSNTDDPNSPGAVYRKEVSLEIDCYTFEQV
jgi:hypothetical protein